MGTIFSDNLLRGAGPKYRRLVNGLQQGIAAGDLPEAEKLPPVRELAWQLGITPGTVARAYSILSDEGWVKTEVGRGTFVVGPPVAPISTAGIAPAVAASKLPLHQEPENDFLFAPRLPDVGQVEIIREAIHASADLPDTALLHYPSFSSQAYLREALYARVPPEERGAIRPQDVMMTNGGQNAIMLTLQTLLAEGPRLVMIEQQSYPGLRRAVELLGGQAVAVDVDGDGVDPKALKRTARKTGARVLFTMPEAQNPTCRVTSNPRRAQVADLARESGFHIVQDDCYRLGPARGPSYRALVPDRAWYISSFSKTISPALRAGYVVTPSAWASKLRRVMDVNYFGISSPAAAILYHVLNHPKIDMVLDEMCRRNRDYIEVALNVLGRFELGWSHDVPFFWLHLPAGWRVSSFCQMTDAKGIRVRPGDDFALRDGPTPQAVRISVNGQMSLSHFRGVLEEIAQLLDHPPETFGV